MWDLIRSDIRTVGSTFVSLEASGNAGAAESWLVQEGTVTEDDLATAKAASKRSGATVIQMMMTMLEHTCPGLGVTGLLPNRHRMAWR